MSTSKIRFRLMLAGLLVTCAFGAVALNCALASPRKTDGGADQTTGFVVLFFERDVVVGESTLIRTDNGITMHLTADDMPAGVYSAWIPIFEPGGMVPVAAGWVAGHVVGEGGELTFTVNLREGEAISGHPVFPAGALEDAQRQDIGMVIRYHGPVDPKFIYEQTHTFEPGVAVDALFTKHNAP